MAAATAWAFVMFMPDCPDVVMVVVAVVVRVVVEVVEEVLVSFLCGRVTESETCCSKEMVPEKRERVGVGE